MAEMWEPNLAPGHQENPWVVDDEKDVIHIHDEEVVEAEVAEIIDLTNDLDLHEEHRESDILRPEEESLQHFPLDQGFSVRQGQTVELREPRPVGKFLLSFVRIQSIIRHTNAVVTIRGHGFTRAKEMNGCLPKQLNECCLVAMVNTHDPRPWKEQAIIDIRPDDVLTIRNLRVTNAPFPRYRDSSSEAARQQVKDTGILVARYVYIEYHQDHDHKPREWAFVRVDEEEADENFRTPSRVLVNDWRGGNVKGGSFIPGDSRQIHDLDAPTIPTNEPTHVPFEQKYTAGDTFSGAGGSCRGIVEAGVHLEFCVDNWEHAVESLKVNFEDTKIHVIDMHDFIVDDSIRYRVDILHLSPPCQVWSPAHTRPGQNDEKNLAILFSCPPLIKKIRPRIFTVEQTFGILHPRFDIFFQSLVQGFTDLGYSVRWKVVNFSHYGLPQPRRRLIMIGAGPGERLPPFPKPTHSPDVKPNQRGGGLKPLATARQVLSQLDGRRQYSLHQPYLQPFQSRKTPWDRNKPLPYTVTCGAAENYHWSGLRQFTPQEYALLQGFPIHHKFAGNYIKKQIGNAFPPIFVKLLYQHLTSWLDDQDNVVRQAPRVIPRVDNDVALRTPVARRQENIVPKGEDEEVTFLSSRKRRALASNTIDLVNDDDGDGDGDGDNKYIRKRARLNISPIRAKQQTIIDLDEDMTALDLVQEADNGRDDARSDTATLRGQSPTDMDSPPRSPVTPFPTRLAPSPPSYHLSAPPSRTLFSHPRPSIATPSSRHRPGQPGQSSPLPSLLRSNNTSSSRALRSIFDSSNGQQAVRRRLFFTVPPPRAQPFSSPSSGSTSSTTTTSSSSSGSGSDSVEGSGSGEGQSPSSNGNGSKSPNSSQVKKEDQDQGQNQKGGGGRGTGTGTKEEPMELFSD
ncbi:RIP defective [Sordaria brevicollis]|uniref:DNA (cytosine-5-)-methyltransferase n=1 Tax=Sordaria brevicollis TaxID=83679 RepID=A0AAE0NW80_SORBR|nr:RIP defective [Sordaria brevicollis]